MIATAAAARALSRQTLPTFSSLGLVRGFANLDAYADYGQHVFTGKVADEYLKKHGASGDLLKIPSWTKTHSDVVAAAVAEW
jgi:glutamine synthetase